MSWRPRTQRVWDLPVRLFHWSLVAAVATAWLTAGHPRHADLHLFAGWSAAALLAFRVIWAVWGTQHARFQMLAVPWTRVKEHVAGLVRGDAPRSTGHNPLAAWATLVVLGLLAGVAVTGVLVEGGEEQRGILAGALSIPAGLVAHEVHEALAWGLLAWVAVHLAGVAKESLRVRENLPAAMIDGKKAGEGVPAAVGEVSTVRVASAVGVPLRGGVAAGMLALGAVGGTAWWTTPAAKAPELARSEAWEAECGSCHLAFHPSLLPARSWERMLTEQDRHFGEDLFLDPETVATLRDYARANAADRGATETAVRIADAVPAGEAPQRIVELPFWEARHEGLTPEDLQAAGGKLGCGKCHGDAAGGAFDDRAIAIPTIEGGRS